MDGAAPGGSHYHSWHGSRWVDPHYKGLHLEPPRIDWVSLEFLIQRIPVKLEGEEGVSPVLAL